MSKGKERADDDMDENADAQEEPDQPESWSAEAYITNANYHAKKCIFLLFINRKLEHCLSFWNNPNSEDF